MSTDKAAPSDADVLQAGPLLLYDGDCGVCSRSVQWILAHERKHSLRFAALNSPLGQNVRAQARVSPEIDSLLWVEGRGETVHALKWSAAVLAAVRYVGGPWRLLLVLAWVPAPIRDAAYRLFARHRLLAAPKSCLIPPPESKARFLGT